MMGLSTERGSKLRGELDRRIAIDTRSLAAFRIAVGVLIIVDVLARSRKFWAFYTEDGLVPQWLARAYAPDHAFSVFYYTADSRVIGVLFALHILVAVFLLVGYWTRIATVISFLLVVSLDHHNPLVLSYADILFRLLLFWAIFLPLGERWAIDAVHRNREPRQSVSSLASLAIIVQMIVMYFANAIHKTTSQLWMEGWATPLIFGIDEIVYLAGPYVREVPKPLLMFVGLLWVYLLLGSPLLLLITGRLRYLYAVTLATGHLGFALTMRIGAFPLVAMAGLLVFVQSPFYRDFASCCRQGRVVPVRVQPRYHTLINRIRSGVQTLPVALCSRDHRHREHTQRLSTLLVVIAVIGIFVMPAVTVLADVTDNPVDPDPKDSVADQFAILGIDQPTWEVFAPNPRHVDRYYVAAARTTEGTEYDVFNDRPLSYDRPFDALHRQHDTYRGRFYMDNVREGPAENGPADVLLNFYCETHHNNGSTLQGIELYVIEEWITMDTITSPAEREREATLIARQTCGDGPMPTIEPPNI